MVFSCAWTYVRERCSLKSGCLRREKCLRECCTVKRSQNCDKSKPTYSVLLYFNSRRKCGNPPSNNIGNWLFQLSVSTILQVCYWLRSKPTTSLSQGAFLMADAFCIWQYFPVLASLLPQKTQCIVTNKWAEVHTSHAMSLHKGGNRRLLVLCYHKPYILHSFLGMISIFISFFVIYKNLKAIC